MLLAFTSTSVDAAHPKKHQMRLNGFSGGMMLHTGWVGGGTISLQEPGGGSLPSQKIKGFPYGIGGALRLHFGDNLRIGTEGYGTYLTYGEYNSKFGIGWGGVLADYQWHFGKLHPYAGMTIGGGAASNLTFTTLISDNDSVVEENVSYRDYGFMAIAPFVGVEYSLSSKARLVVKADWLFNASNPQPDFPSGPRIYVGFTFYYLKNNSR